MTFFSWLCGLDKTELGQVIASRPEVALLARPPRDRAELAARLQSEPLIGVHYLTAGQPAHEVAEMIAASGGHSTVEALAKAFDLAADDRDLLDAVGWLTTRGLAWPDAQGLHLVPALLQFIPRPHGLGGQVRAMLEAQTVSVLTAITARWGLRTERTKARVVAAMADWLAVPDNIRHLLRAAPANIRTEIERLAWDGPVTTATRSPAVMWALEHGLAYNQYWNTAEMPGEVGRAIRGPAWRPAFTPRPPEPTTVTVAPGMAARESAAAAMTALEQVGAMMAECARKPVPALKTGGIGVRELRRLSKVVGCGELYVRLWLEVAFEASFLELEGEEPDNVRLLATAEYDAWLAEEPAARLTQLLIAWSQLATEPHTDAKAEARVPALVEPDAASPLLALARQELLTAANRLPRDKGLVAYDGLASVIAWHRPGLRLEPASLTSIWREAQALGIVACGTITPLGRALATTADDQLVAAARDLVGIPTTSAIFQADLTTVVPGIPSYTLARLLDSAADRESRGGALIWRFSNASVRRALDAGITPDELTAELIAVSGGGVIPQPLAYLISDIGRQHGRIRVRDIGCVIHGVDEALLAEILTAKALRGLGLTRLAQNVLAAASPQAETLAALRAAGYFPAAEQPNGNPQVPITIEPRAAAASPQQTRRGIQQLLAPHDASARETDPYDLAEQLCGRPPGNEPKYTTLLPGFPLSLADPSGELIEYRGLGEEEDYQGSPEHSFLHLAIEEYTDTLDSDSVCTLATAIEDLLPVRVTYRPIGSRTKLRAVIEPETVAGEYVRGRDLSAGRQVRLRLGDIERVRPM